ncbi:MAG: tRNA 2-selenouridine(34) synthase MnmH [Hydrogenophilales bacterium 28-61-23]|nr:MAG: tRNA 2-selenouridine(34) synthase MnmH [Hydrogenophilales bacterium 28-61-23]
MTGTQTSVARRRKDGVASVAEMFDFDEIIDARSPGEYNEDHLPGAISLPVLNDEERAMVGTLHKQSSAFEAKKVGAALVARNIADHLESYFRDKPRNYRPLIYCWRGGSRSGAMTTILRSVGWNAAQLEGGHKAYRHFVIEELARLPAQFEFRVICGPTGVGKSRFLRELKACKAQVLDLEDLAAHMGSVLGAYPARPQPAQKLFESRVWHTLQSFDPERPIFVESESKKIGNLHTPEELLKRMRAATCINLHADIPVRVELLKQEYAHFLIDAESLGQKLDCLTTIQGKEQVENWKVLARSGRWDELVAELLIRHYDPAYTRSLDRNYVGALSAATLELPAADSTTFAHLARQLIDSIS